MGRREMRIALSSNMMAIRMKWVYSRITRPDRTPAQSRVRFHATRATVLFFLHHFEHNVSVCGDREEPPGKMVIRLK